jgi:hypothetical protein
MRNLIPLLLILTVNFGACTKTGTATTTTTGGGNPPPPPPPAGSGSVITITGISSLHPYPGDVITITGTGFDPDKTKDTVNMGFVVNGGFKQNGQGNYSEFVGPFATKIISATSTEIKFMNDSAMVVNTPKGEVPIAFQVKTPAGKYNTGDTILYKDNPSFGFTYSDPGAGAFCYAALYTGDSIYVFGKGLYPPLALSVEGKAIQLAAVTKPDIYGRENVTGFIPLGFFGAASPDPNSCPLLTALSKFTVTNGDGRSYTWAKQFFHGPNTVIAGADLDALAYSVSAHKNPLLTLIGYALRSDYTLRITGIITNSVQPFSEEIAFSIGGFPNIATQEIDLGALPVPIGQTDSYNIEIRAGSGSYSLPIASFDLIP